MVDALKTIGVEADGIIGHSVGEIACGYADGCLSARDTILIAYWRGHAVKLANIKNGAMAAVGMYLNAILTLNIPGYFTANSYCALSEMRVIQ